MKKSIVVVSLIALSIIVVLIVNLGTTALLSRQEYDVLRWCIGIVGVLGAIVVFRIAMSRGRPKDDE